MSEYRVYTLGGDNTQWRSKIESSLNYFGDVKYKFIHPTSFKKSLDAKEYIVWIINQIKKSDIIIVNLDDVNQSDYFELGAINALNIYNNKHAFVIGVGEWKDEIKGYVENIIFHHETNFEDAADYITSMFD